MTQRVLPEWSKDELEYVEPTQVVRSFGYDVFANEVSEEALLTIASTRPECPKS